MKKLIGVLLLALAVIISSAFTPNILAQSTTNFLVLHHGYYTHPYTKRQTRVITSQAEYAAALVAYTDDEPQQLDFNAGRVLLVDMGPRPTGGFSIEVVSVREETKGAVIAEVRLTKPGSNCLTTQSVTNPFQFVYIPTRREILISEKLATLNCDGASGTENGRLNIMFL